MGTVFLFTANALQFRPAKRLYSASLCCGKNGEGAEQWAMAVTKARSTRQGENTYGQHRDMLQTHRGAYDLSL